MIPALLAALLLAQAPDPVAEAARQRQARINDLRKQIEAADENARLKAIEELGTVFHSDARALLVAKLSTDSDKVRLAAGKALILQKHPVCAQALGSAIQANTRNDKLVKSFIGLLAELDMCASIPVLFHVLDTRPASGPDALEAMVKIGCPECLQEMVNFLKRAETEEKKPDFFENLPQGNTKGQPPQPRTNLPEKIENKTKNKPLAAMAPKVRESLKALTGKSFDNQRDWSSALASGSLSTKLVSVYLCELTREKFEVPPGKSKKCPHAGESKTDHDDDFLKHRRE